VVLVALVFNLILMETIIIGLVEAVDLVGEILVLLAALVVLVGVEEDQLTK
jgi:hypothetical protein